MVNSKNINNLGSPGDESTRTSIEEEDIKVKVEITADELDEFKYHLNSLPVKECGDLLKQLRLFQEIEFNKDKNSSGKELDSENNIKQKLWKEYSATKEEESADKKLEEDTVAYVCIANAQSLLSGTIPSGKLTSGFEMMLTSCADNVIGRTAVILQKNERGKDAISRKKTRDKVVQALKPEISARNISRILTSIDADKYNVASKVISYQAIMNSIHHFCIQYYMKTLLKIPVDVNLLQPLLVKKATKFFNAIKD
jgi:hypothetical protein